MTPSPLIEAFVLKPLAAVYGLGTRWRNLFFDRGVLPCKHYPVPVICVGNIRVGGTGKTPMVEHLLHLLLKEGYRPAVVSRGYKRSTSGLQIAHTSSSASEIGDEPRQIKQKFPEVTIAIDANRRRAIDKLMTMPTEERPDVILLDDGFQHRYVQPSLAILLTDHANLFYQDKLLPWGRLREGAEARYRADIVVVTRCPSGLQPIDYSIIERNMALYAHQILIFSQVAYSTPLKVFPQGSQTQKLPYMSRAALAIAGIADPSKFYQALKHKIGDIQTVTFPDHHRFGASDADRLNRAFGSLLGSTQPDKHPIAICTEKDAQRLADIRHLLSPALIDNLYYLPIHVSFRDYGQNSLDQAVLKHLRQFGKEHSNPYN